MVLLEADRFQDHAAHADTDVALASRACDVPKRSEPEPGCGHRGPARRALRLGIIASEIPPGHGGMQEHARGLVDNLSQDHEIVVFTGQAPVSDIAGRNVTVRPVMRWSVADDVLQLAHEPVDAWITLNAGLAPYSCVLKAPLFAYVHGNDFTRPWYPMPGRAVRNAGRLAGPAIVQRWRSRQIGAGLRAARWMFANSAFSRDLCASLYGVPASRFTVVPPGMRQDFFRDGDPGRSDRLRLVTVARLDSSARRKNIEGVLEAIALLRGEIDCHYTVIGDGDDLARLICIADRLGLSGRVRFLGSVSTETVIEEFGRSDAFIMAVKPSGGDVEGFGMVYAEAAATGLPSIATTMGGIPEVIEDGVTGVLLRDISVAGIAESLRAFHDRRHSFDRTMIRAKARRFASAPCTATIAAVIEAMI
ncbi:glycosyltransferase family 4 protein [Lichenicoccus sp.]|uniref:glycosyltransferase family 4 protein n=1 Tax=Lichenicoccus sp. TaxID=2781899 RepID=UPI003D0E40A7